MGGVKSVAKSSVDQIVRDVLKMASTTNMTNPDSLKESNCDPLTGIKNSGHLNTRQFFLVK